MNSFEKKERTSKTLLAKRGTPKDYNEAVYFVIDPKKSGYMTGADLIIDGGWTTKGL
jgi:NAD(P)-dependent dehydrogenase (short-subunit alcohol dehydrogenase family)